MGIRHRMTAGMVAALLGFLIAVPASAAGLESGEKSNLVSHLQIQLAESGFYRGAVDGEFGPRTAQAVMAFHKHLGLERTFTWQPDDWSHLENMEPIAYLGEPAIIADLDRQVIYYHQASGEVAVIPISSANGETYRGRGGRLATARTPQGEFRLQRHIPAMRISYLGGLWKPWYFSGGYAIHGSSSVPAYPASHGCVRVPNWEADWLSSDLSVGMRVSIGRSGGVEPPPADDRSAPAPRDVLLGVVQ